MPLSRKALLVAAYSTWTRCIVCDEHSNVDAFHLRYYDSLSFSGNVPAQRDKNINVFRNASVDGHEDVLVYTTAVFFPLSISYSDTNAPNDENAWAFMDMTSVNLAIYHLNNGIGDIIPALNGLNETCPIRFTANFYDTESVANIATKQLNDATIGLNQDLNRNRLNPSGVFGAYGLEVTRPLATISNLNGLFHAGVGSNNLFDDKNTFPLVGRVSSSGGEPVAVVSYLKFLGISHCAMIYHKDTLGNARDGSFQKEAVKNGITVLSFSVTDLNYLSDEEKQKEAEAVIGRLKQTQFRYIYVDIYYYEYEDIMEEAYKQKVVGPGFNWILSSSLTASEVIDLAREGNYQPGSPLYVATQGLSTFSTLGGLETNDFPNYESFLNIWGSMDDNMINYTNEKWPKYDPQNPNHNFTIPYATAENFRRGSDFFPPDMTVVYNFDGIVAMGLSACAAAKNNNGTSFDGKEQFDAFTTMDTVEGVSGFLKITPEGSRDPYTQLYAITNIFSRGEANNDGLFPFEDNVTYLLEYDRSKLAPVWKKNPNGQLHIYSDGSNIAPNSLPTLVLKTNHIGRSLRVTVLILCAIIVLFSVFCGVWTQMKKSTQAVRSAQPFFLFMICCGTLIMSMTIVPLSIDDAVVGVHGCSIACMAAPWLYFIGFVITFSALFTKTWRINKIMKSSKSFKRVRISVYDVLPPFAILITVNVLLLSLWTALSPLEWNRVIIQRDRFGRAIESYGICQSENKSHANVYISLLCAVNGCVLLFALYQGHLSRKLSTAFNESYYITMIMMSIFQVWFIGIPLMFFLNDQPQPSLFVRMGIIVIICLAVLSLMFIPKMMNGGVEPRAMSQLQRTSLARLESGKGIEILLNPSRKEDSIFELKKEQKKWVEERKRLESEKESLIAILRAHSGMDLRDLSSFEEHAKI